MLELFYWPTPNGHKITLFFEEAGLEEGADYQLRPVNIGIGEQFAPEFLQIAPNNRIPALVDHAPAHGEDSLSLFESGAILVLASTGPGRYQVLQWLFWQMAGLGPMAGQNHHFGTYADEQIPYAIDRYVNETARLYAVLNKQLRDGRDYIVGDYSIADMACYPWIVPHQRQRQNLQDFPHLKAWFERVAARPATQRAYQKGDALKQGSTMTAAAKKLLFGQNAATVG